MKGGHYQQGPETWSLTRAGTPDEGLLCRSHSSHSLTQVEQESGCGWSDKEGAGLVWAEVRGGEEALARDGVSREVPCSALKGETPQTWVQSLGQKDPLEEGMATDSRILAWRPSWTEEPDGLQSMGSLRVGHD